MGLRDVGHTYRVPLTQQYPADRIVVALRSPTLLLHLRRLTRIIQTCIAACAALFLQRIQYPRSDDSPKKSLYDNGLALTALTRPSGYRASRRPCIQYPRSSACC